MSNYCTCHIDKDNCFWCDYQVVKRSLETCRKANKRYREALENIRTVKYDDEFNPYAYMMLEIIEWAEEALKGCSDEKLTNNLKKAGKKARRYGSWVKAFKEKSKKEVN